MNWMDAYRARRQQDETTAGRSACAADQMAAQAGLSSAEASWYLRGWQDGRLALRHEIERQRERPNA